MTNRTDRSMRHKLYRLRGPWDSGWRLVVQIQTVFLFFSAHLIHPCPRPLTHSIMLHSSKLFCSKCFTHSLFAEALCTQISKPHAANLTDHLANLWPKAISPVPSCKSMTDQIEDRNFSVFFHQHFFFLCCLPCFAIEGDRDDRVKRKDKSR